MPRAVVARQRGAAWRSVAQQQQQQQQQQAGGMAPSPQAGV
jgi:hypothetical protein